MPDWTFIGSLILPNAGGWASTLTMIGQVKKPDGKAWYETIKKPSWNPPDWAFGPAWTLLYTSMGYASYVIYKDCGGLTERAALPLALYGGQLVLNWTWTPIFFGCHKIGLYSIGIWLSGYLCPGTWNRALIFSHNLAEKFEDAIFTALAHMAVLDIAATACTISFATVNKNTAYFMAPYLCWLGFATALNYAIWKLNRDDNKKVENVKK